MVSKAALLVLGLLAMVVLISPEGAARDLTETSTISKRSEVVKEQNDVGDVKYGKEACIEGDGGKSPNCFGWVPGYGGGGMPGGGGVPGYGGGGGGIPKIPGVGMPGGGYGGGPGGGGLHVKGHN